jgi:predicted site-specific integrase-resolvase
MKTNKQDKKYSELMTYTEYAKHKKISLKTVYNHVKSGLIKPLIIGKSKFIKLNNEHDKLI